MARGAPTVTFVAEIVGAGRGAAARPAFDRGEEVPMSAKTRGEAKVGDLVRVTVRGRAATVTARFGTARSPAAIMAALLAHENLGRNFSKDVEAEAVAIDEGDPLQDAGRRDMVAQSVVTIDPHGAKDHDDAIAAEVEGKNIRLWVHIADVAHYIAPGGAIDHEAERRGCSVYLPGIVDPMLPARLSNDLCSLRPEVVRRAVTAEMLIGPDGEVSGECFYRSAIRSERRLTYPEVDAHLAGTPLDGGPAMDATITAAREGARRLRKLRMARGALEVDSAEPVFQIERDRVLGVHLEAQTESHRIVEDCMIAANEAVARYLIARGRPALHRFHDEPDGRRIERLYDQLEELGVATRALPPAPLTPTQRRDAAKEAAGAVARHRQSLEARGRPAPRALSTLVLRSLSQAYYTPGSVGHSGLASAAYVHFTSPIRRYPDLLIHRALLDALGIGGPGPDTAWLAEAGQTSSDTERAASSLERRGDRICATLLLERTLADRGWEREWEGEVTGLVPVGAFVSFGDAFEGFLHVKAIGREEYKLDRMETALLGETSGKGLHLGDPVTVRVVRMEPLRGRVQLERAEAGAPRAVMASRARRRSARAPR